MLPWRTEPSTATTCRLIFKSHVLFYVDITVTWRSDSQTGRVVVARRVQGHASLGRILVMSGTTGEPYFKLYLITY